MGLLPVEAEEEVMEAAPLEEGEGPVLAQRPSVEEAEAPPAVEEPKEEAKEAEEAEAPAKKRPKAAKAEPSAEAEDDEIPEWKRKLMEITGEGGGE